MKQYPYPLYDEKEKVVCQICGKSFLIITPRHLVKHNVNYDDYFRRFPDAPRSNKEFATRGKYGRNKDLFIHPENEKPDEDILSNEPELEELDDVEKFIQTETRTDPMKNMKARLFDHLKLYFSNMKMDYLVRQFGTDKKLKFEFITDYCDPMLKVIIQFPDTFWHNHDTIIDLNKTLKLEQYGWQVYKIRSKNPTFAQIDEALKNL